MKDAIDAKALEIRADAHGVSELIVGRWSPRSLETREITEQDLAALLAAAHWAPSCFNEQPWRFLVARRPEHLERMRECLTETNRIWADRAPLLIAVLSKPDFALDKRPNRWHAFDSGAAWGYLALEASRRGLAAHAMAGFSPKKIRETFHIPADWTAHAVVAVGFRGPAEVLPPELRERERPTPRHALETFWHEGPYGDAT